MCRSRSLRFAGSTVVAVVVMKAAELQAGSGNGVYQGDDFTRVGLLDASAVHAGINIEKNYDRGLLPLANLLFVFSQDGNAHVSELLRDFARPACVAANGWIG